MMMLTVALEMTTDSQQSRETQRQQGVKGTSEPHLHEASLRNEAVWGPGRRRETDSLRAELPCNAS